jgi:diaminohydroxyphosphoribosylaminopyrimidine deaminase / 5-amino-6-(5-phosphoribosylamino)uracil reductase
VASDADYMARALALAERGRGTTSPNPMVGALVVDDEGVVVGRGSHKVAGGPHAEILALADAGERSRGATLYCTLEPCSHTGRTGPCAPQIGAAGIRRAVLAMEDPNPLVSGKGIRILRGHGLDVAVGILERDARRLNAPFLTRICRARPHITMKVALSADGKVALEGSRPIRLTGDVADRRIHRDRAEVDAIAIGSGTMLQDDPLLTPRIAFRRRPLTRVIFDRRLRTPPTARVLSTLESGPVIIVTGASAAGASPERVTALERAGATVQIVSGEAPTFVDSALRHLAESGTSSVILEGGPTVHRAFWDRGLVDRVQMYVVPRAIGADGVGWWSTVEEVLAKLDDVRSTTLGADISIEGDVHRID